MFEMKRISAVICELNPLHDGHRFIFSRTAENADLLIAVMSGNFVQRGECAVYDKYIRAKCAIDAGADMVVELPFPFSSSSAEFFAAAGVAVAKGVGATDLYFGSECADLEALMTAAEILNDACDHSFGRAAEQRAKKLREACSELPQSLLSSPNDILGAEYCRSEGIILHPVRRIHTTGASALRREIFSLGADRDAVYPERLRELEFNYFRSHRSGEVFAEGGGGVAGRLYNAAIQTNDSEQWMSLAATKQYTNARLRRAALFALCGVSSDAMRQLPLYTVLLAANKKGREYLRSAADKFTVELVTNPSDRHGLSTAAAEQYCMRDFADKLFTLCANIPDPSYFAKHSPIIL